MKVAGGCSPVRGTALSAVNRAGLPTVKCTCHENSLHAGAALLDHLHAHLEGADAAAAPLLRRLLLASYRPYAEQLEDWLFRPATCLPPGSAFCGQLPAHLACLLPSAASTQAGPQATLTNLRESFIGAIFSDPTPPREFPCGAIWVGATWGGCGIKQ